MAQSAYRPPTAFSIMPPVVKNLLIINVLVFLAQIAFGGYPPHPANVVNRWFALWPAGLPEQAPQLFWPWQVVTSAFLHGGFGHILMNMFGLWMFGMRIENVLGSQRFALFYFACVLGASLLQLVVASLPFWTGTGTFDDIYPTVGASGGVLGVLAAFGLLYPDEPIYLYFFVPIPAKWLVLGFAAFSLFAGYADVQAGVAHFAHLGGLLTGALLIQYWRGRFPFRRRQRVG